MKSKLLMLLLVLIVMLGVSVPSVAQGDWPEGCQLPDLEEAMNASDTAQANGDVVAFVNSLSDMNHVVDKALRDCLEASVKDDVDLSETNLSQAHLQMAQLNGANLQGANLADSNLQWASLVGANLQDAWFCASEPSFYFTYADLQSANLSGTNLRGAKLCNVNLQSANLSNANLEGARSLNVNLQYADLRGANLQDAILFLANMKGATLAGANLQSTYFKWVGMLNVDFSNAVFDENTILPDGTNWAPDTKMGRFTNPEHPDFWELDLCQEPGVFCGDGE